MALQCHIYTSVFLTPLKGFSLRIQVCFHKVVAVAKLFV